MRQALLQLEIPIDPVVAEFIENRGLIGIELHRLEKIRLGLRPFAEPLIAHAAKVPVGPVRLLRLAGQLDRLGVILGGAFEIALAAVGIAANAICPRIFRIEADRLAVVPDGALVIALGLVGSRRIASSKSLMARSLSPL